MSDSIFDKIAAQGFAFAVFPDARIYEQPGIKSKQHLLFGDYITPPKLKNGRYKKWTKSLLLTQGDVQWLNVRSRQEEGWIRLSDLQAERVLEINFVDIGQGDGCHLVTPSDDHFIIDAGEGDNMYRFLRWRFNLHKPGKALPRFYAMVSHPDEDHWKGFEYLLSKPPANQARRIEFEKLYHNGIIQRSGATLGLTTKFDGLHYLEDFVINREQLDSVMNLPGKKSNYEKFLAGAIKNFPSLKIETSARDLSPGNILYQNSGLSLEILGPIPETINGKQMLPWFDPGLNQIGKTKNGHSIILMAQIGKMKILLGGDLNSKSADYLMQKYSKSNIRMLRKQIAEATTENQGELLKKMETLIADCRIVFQSDIAKSCHHGSHDITNEFLQAINTIVTVISSGDEESFCHPRPETLGAIGKFSRGERPLIFSTELARSSPEFIQLNAQTAKSDAARQRIVSTYGMITVRSNGENAIIAQKLEKPRSSFGLITKWQIDKLIWNTERGEFVTK